LYRHLEFHAAWGAVPGVQLRIDASKALPVPEGLEHYRRTAMEAGWKTIRLVSGIGFGMDELALLCEPLEGELASPAALRATVRAFAGAESQLGRRVSLYVHLPAAAYQFYASDFFRVWQVVLSPGFNPDVFAALGKRDCRWTQPTADFVTQERLLAADALNDAAVYKVNSLDFLRMFWKFLALAIAEYGARAGEATLAQTPEGVVTALKNLDLPLALFLEDFALAYRKELEGTRADIGRWIPAAVQYLKQINYAL